MREHRTDLPWPCSCDECARAAAGSWMSKVDRVVNGDITLAEAQALQDKEEE